MERAAKYEEVKKKKKAKKKEWYISGMTDCSVASGRSCSHLWSMQLGHESPESVKPLHVVEVRLYPHKLKLDLR